MKPTTNETDLLIIGHCLTNNRNVEFTQMDWQTPNVSGQLTNMLQPNKI